MIGLTHLVCRGRLLAARMLPRVGDPMAMTALALRAAAWPDLAARANGRAHEETAHATPSVPDRPTARRDGPVRSLGGRCARAESCRAGADAEAGRRPHDHRAARRRLPAGARRRAG